MSCSTPATVIGARGYVGRALVQALQDRGRTVHVPGRSEESQLRELCEIGDLYYCAGLTADYALSPAATAEAHLGLFSRLLDTLQPRRVVYLSSTRLFDSRAGESVSESTPLLLDPLNPRHLYDLTKAAGESICLAMAGERARVARLSCVWSLETDAPGFLPSIVRRIQASSGAVSLASHPTAARHYIHRDDLVQALIAMADADHHPAITCLAAEEQATTNQQLADSLEHLLHRSIYFQAPPAERSPVPPPSLDLTVMRSLPISGPKPLLEHLVQLL